MTPTPAVIVVCIGAALIAAGVTLLAGVGRAWGTAVSERCSVWAWRRR